MKRVPGLVSVETALLSRHSAFSVSPHMALFLWRRMISVASSLFIRTPVLSINTPSRMTSFNLNYLLKGFISKYIYIGVKASTCEFKGGHNSLPNPGEGQNKSCSKQKHSLRWNDLVMSVIMISEKQFTKHIK